MSAALIGGLVVVIIMVVVAILMMGEMGSPAPAPAPSISTDEVTDPDQLASGVAGAAEEAGGAAAEAASVMDDQDDTAAVAVEVTDEDPMIDPADVDGLVGHYTGDSWDEDQNIWKDLSSAGNDITDVKGTPLVFDADDLATEKYVYGGKEDGFRIPQECLTRGKKYTFIHVARYGSTNKADQHRIFDGIDGNNLSGFHNQHIGMAHRNGSGAIAHWWNEDNYMQHFYGIGPDEPSKFLVQVDQKRKFRTDGMARSGHSGGREVITSQMTVNMGEAERLNWGGHGEKSIWNIGEMLFFNRVLSEDDIFKIENYLFKKWDIPRKLYVAHGGWPHNNWKREDGWSSDRPWGGMSNTGVACGSDGVMNMYRSANRHHYHDGNQWRPNRHWYPEGSCTNNITDGQDQKLQEKKGPVVNIRDTSTTDRQKYYKLMNIDCKNKGINSYRFEKVGEDNMRLVYKCHNRPVIRQSCADGQTYSHGRANRTSQDIYEAIDLLDVSCGAKALTKIEAYDKENGELSFKSRCCALEDLA